MSNAQEEEQHLRECESYIQTHRIQRLLKDCIAQLCVSRPDNPIVFLRQYFQKLERRVDAYFDWAQIDDEFAATVGCAPLVGC
uniref:RIIa domain-containing protein n=1 Tax=Anopheles stephensi TaxID=30069 RepID=A0A182YNW2_ANOST